MGDQVTAGLLPGATVGALVEAVVDGGAGIVVDDLGDG
jgi:hypothetical protein